MEITKKDLEKSAEIEEKDEERKEILLEAMERLNSNYEQPNRKN